MAKNFEQLNLFAEKSSPALLTSSSAKKPFVSPHILIECLSESSVRTNSVYYLRIINKTAKKTLSHSAVSRKIFFHSLLSELALKKGLKSPLDACRAAILNQTFLDKLKK